MRIVYQGSPLCPCTAGVLFLSLVGCGAGLSSETTEVEFLQPASDSREMPVPQAIVVDNDSAGFHFWTEPGYHNIQRHPEAWISSSDVGEEGFMGVNYLKARAGYHQPQGGDAVDGSEAAAGIIWGATLKPGTYDVEVTVAPAKTNTNLAMYCITTQEPPVVLGCAEVNQRAPYNGKGAHLLGRYKLDEFTKVWLDPAASTLGSGDVVADSVRFTEVAWSPR